jgi:putative Mn2+ efflux pump MntP
MIRFFVNNIILGVGLAMDAFSVSLANGLAEPNMPKSRMAGMAAVFGGFQFLMPFLGWFCVHSIVTLFSFFQPFIPWIALGLLVYIGWGMIKEGREGDISESKAASWKALLIQGVATSIDALSVGFTIADYTLGMAFAASLLIGIVTFVICYAGVGLGKKFGLKLANKASIFGGLLLIAIGLEIFITSFL